MLHLVNAENRHQPYFADLLEQSYRVRHDIYVNVRGWKALGNGVAPLSEPLLKSRLPWVRSVPCHRLPLLLGHATRSLPG